MEKSTLEMENAAGECVCYNALGIEQGGTVEFHFHLQTKSNRLLKWYSYIDRPIEIGNIQVLGVQGTVEMSAVEGEQIGGGKWRFGGLKFEYDFDLSKSIEGDITIKCQMEELPLSIGFKTIQNVLNNKEAHIEQLLESERRLENNLRVQVIEKEKWEQRTEEKQIALKMLEHKFEKLEKHCKAMEELCKRLEDEGNQAKINCELKQTHIVNLDSIITNQHKHIEELEALQKSILESKRWKILSWISKLIPKRK